MAETDRQLAGPSSAGAAALEPRKAKEGYTPTPEERLLIDRVTTRVNYSARDSTRWALERQWFETIAFQVGLQWIEYSDASRRWSKAQAPSWLPTPMTNYLATRVNRMVAALLRIEPQGRVRPNTSEARDRQAAKVGEQLIGHFYDVTDEDALRQAAALAATLTGTVVAYDGFNPRAGRMLRIPRQKLVEQPVMDPAATCPTCGFQQGPEEVGQLCPVCQDEAQPLEAGETPHTLPDGTPAMDVQMAPEFDEQGEPVVDEMPEGEIVSFCRMLFNFYWDPKASTLKEARWCGEALYVDLDWIDENFPDRGPFVAGEGGIESASFYEASLLALVGPSAPSTAHYGGHQMFQGGAVLRRYQEKPSQKHPRGLELVVANGVLLYQGAMPITDENGVPTGDFSYTEFKFDPVPGRFAGRTPAEDMVPCQRRINGIDAQLILNQKTLLSPWVLAPKGSGLNPGQVALRPGSTVLYNFVGVGASPQVVQGQPMPAQIMEQRTHAIEAMNEMAEDVSDTLGTKGPENMRSGIALNLGREVAEEMKVPRRKRWALWVKERDRKRLLLAQRHYREARAIKTLGAGSEWQVRQWKGADLLGNTDVAIDPGSLVPRSPTIKAQTAFDLIEAGIIDPQDPRQRQRLLELVGLPEFEPETAPDQRRAEAENAALEAGEQALVRPTDDHAIHQAVLLQAMKDPSFDHKPPEVQQGFQMHLQAHQEAAMAQEKAAMREQAKAQRVQVKEQVKDEAVAESERVKLGLATGDTGPEAGNGNMVSQ